jgi:outer membrane protein assembly factor BamB
MAREVAMRKRWLILLMVGMIWGYSAWGGTWWPMGGHDPARSSAVPETILPPLVEVWEAPLPGKPQAIVAAGGTVVVAVHGRYSWVMALKSDTGEEKWRFQVTGVRGNFKSSPAIRGALIFVGGQLSDSLYALDIQTGQVRWDLSGLTNLYTDPAVVRDRVIVSSPTGLRAITHDSGQVIWETEPETVGSPAVTEELVFTLVWGGELAAFSLISGEEVWRTGRAWGGSPSDPVLVGNFLSLVMNDTVWLWDQTTGRFRGKITLPHQQSPGKPQRPATLQGKIFIPLAGEEASWLVAVDVMMGWTFWARTMKRPVYTPCITGKAIYVATGNSLLSLNRETGELMWKRTFPAEASTAPIAAGRSILCGFGNTLYRLVPKG